MGVREFTVEKRGVGLPDYAVRKPVGAVPVGPVYTSTDIAELAARLGSINTFDRRGNVIFLDDFENGLSKWRPWQSAAGHQISLSNERARSGAVSVKLATDPAFVAGDAWIEHHMTFPTISKLGVEFSFSLGLEAGALQVGEIYLEIDAYDGVNASNIYVSWISTPALGVGGGIWQYYGSDGAYHDLGIISRFDIGHWFYTFNTVKMVFDLATTKYARLLVNSASHNISSLDYNKFGDIGTAPRLTVNIGIHRVGIPDATMYADDVIITQNEPDNPTA